MVKLIEITGKAISGEWGTDDETGDGIPVLRTTNFTNEGVINYSDIVTRTITKKNIDEKFLRKEILLLKSQVEVISFQLEESFILMEKIILIYLITLLDYSE